MTDDASPDPATATDGGTVVASYPAADGAWVGEALGRTSYVRYLRRARAGPVAPGDRWPEFVSRGCGAPRDVVLRVERVTGPAVVGPKTAFAFVPRRDGDAAEDASMDDATDGAAGGDGPAD